MTRYDLQIMREDGSSFVITSIEADEVADFIELYDDAEQFAVLPCVEVETDPDGGLPIEDYTQESAKMAVAA